jgi:hypothetical protein
VGTASTRYVSCVLSTRGQPEVVELVAAALAHISQDGQAQHRRWKVTKRLVGRTKAGLISYRIDQMC